MKDCVVWIFLRLILSALVAAVISGLASGQIRTMGQSDGLTCAPTPCVVPPIQASEGGSLVNDTAVVVNPLNPKDIMVGTNDWNCPNFQDSSYLGFHLSKDGGSTWGEPVCMSGGIHIGRYVYFPDGIPNVGYDRNGTAYIAGAYFDNEGGATGLVAIEKSNDGISWSQPSVVLRGAFTFPNYNWLTVDTSLESPRLNSLYLAAVVVSQVKQAEAVVASHSEDGGATWNVVKVYQSPPSPAAEAFTNMSIGQDGTVYVTWLHCVNNGPAAHCGNGTAYLLFSKSADGGNTWSKPALMSAVNLFNHLCECPWSDLPNAKVRISNYPIIGVDNSNGPYAGNLYVVMYSWTGTYMRVGVIRSTDGGNTWSKPVPVAPPSANHDQFFPWLSVSPNGLVGVSWLDRRNDPANVKYQAFAAISRDGGQSFQPNVQLTTAFSDPNVNGYPGNSWMGDYTGNTWAGPNNFIAAWMDSSNGVNMQAVVGGIRLK